MFYRPRHRRRLSAFRQLWQFHATILLFVATTLTGWGWVGNILNPVGNSVTRLVSAIFDLFNNLYDAIESSVQWLHDRVIDSLVWIGNYGWDAWNTAQWAVGALQRQWDSIWAGILDWAHWARNEAINWAANNGNQIWNYVSDTVAGVNAAFDSMRRWVLDNLWSPIMNRIYGVESWISNRTDSLENMIHGVERSIAGAAINTVNALFGPLIRPFSDRLETLWNLFDRSRHFLEYVIDHPYDWWIRLLQDAMNKLQRNMTAWILEGLQKESGAVEEWISKWF